MLIMLGVLTLLLAVFGSRIESDACKNCKADKGYCIICSHHKYNRSIFYPIKHIFKHILKL